jgi:MYXO-CTERM domain-containing protein
VTPTGSAPTPVPTLPGTLLGLLALVMAGLGWRRLV